MTSTATVKTIRIGRTRVSGETGRAGTAVLTPVLAESGTVYLVSTDQVARDYFGGGERQGTIGGIGKVRNGWAVVAYRDRAHMANRQGPVTFLPNAKSRASAVRGLLRFYNLSDRGQEIEPCELSARARNQLMD